MLQKEDLALVGQLLKSVEEAQEKLETAYTQSNQNAVEIIRDFMIKAENKIIEILT